MLDIRSNTRRWRLGAAAALIAIPMAILPATQANAAPYAPSCAIGTDGARGSYAVCTMGNGAYRSWTQCRTWSGFWYMRYGTWRVPSNPVRSVSACSWGDTRYSYGYNLS